MRIKNTLRKLIYELRISFTNKKFRKKLKVLVAFLINQKTGGHLGFLPALFFSQNHSIKIMRKPFSQKNRNKYANSSAESQNQNMY